MKMKRFELIEHTADIGLIAYGETLAEAFANAAYGMFSIIAELDAVRETESRNVEIEERRTGRACFLSGLTISFTSLMWKCFSLKDSI